MGTVLQVPAIAFDQNGRTLYSLVIDGKLLPHVATTPRIHRNDTDLAGYQRAEVGAHIRGIRDYIDSGDGAFIPNALTVAFTPAVTFTPTVGTGDAGPAHGLLTIPTGGQPVGMLVDGQQRTAAIRDANIDSFLMPAVAFITDDPDEQRTQFMLVNASKPLPSGLINELLPGTAGKLPLALERRRAPAALTEQLNVDPDSPLHGRIKTVTNPDGTISDTSMIKTVAASISDGALYDHRDPATGRIDTGPALALLHRWWDAVTVVFNDAFDVDATPRTSRLLHGAGIAAIGALMDTVIRRTGRHDTDTFVTALTAIAPRCAWTSGTWTFAGDDVRPWNAVANTPTDTRLLSEHLRTLWLNATDTTSAAA